jgi:hypothetical protein
MIGTRGFGILLTGMILLGGASLAPADLIDGFDDGSAVLDQMLAGASSSDTQSSLTGVIGGTRGAELTKNAGSPFGRTIATVNVDGYSNGLLTLSSDAFTKSSLKLVYGSLAGAADLGYAVPNPDTTLLRLNYDASALPDHDFVLQVTARSGGVDYIGSMNVAAGSNESVILLDTLLDTGGNALTGAPIDGFEVLLDGSASAGLDVAVDSIETETNIPEPASMVLASLAGAALLRRRRR